VVLERGDRVGYTWENLYEGLVLHTGKHLSALPGMPFPASTPIFPTRRDCLDYLRRYSDAFRVPVQTRANVSEITRAADGWIVRTDAGDRVLSRSLVVATGIVSNPYVPSIPGREMFRGRVMHSVEYRRPQPFEGRRVLVVGAGNSAAEISAELAAAGADVTVAIRSGARVVPRTLLGIPIQYIGVLTGSLPRSVQRLLASITDGISQRLRGPTLLPPPRATDCAELPLIGFHLVDGVRRGAIHLKGALHEFTDAGVRFCDGSEQPFDQVILATGYNAALGVLGTQIRVDECGFAVRRERVVSVDQPDLFFVGQNYDSKGALWNIRRDARLTAKFIARSRVT
jgi:cation diffusion facilitator CzcD-associated flavoprotein CzcO